MLFAKLNCSLLLTFVLFKLLTAATIKTCQDITLAWSTTVPWHITHNTSQSTETIAILPPFTNTPESNVLGCNYESVIIQCLGCNENLYFDAELKALLIRGHFLGPELIGKITAAWPDGNPAVSMLPFQIEFFPVHDKLSDQEVFPSSFGTVFTPHGKTAEESQQQLPGGSIVTGERKLQTSVTQTPWWPDNEIIYLIPPQVMPSSQSYTIGATQKTFSIYHFSWTGEGQIDVSPWHFIRKYSVTLDDGSPLPSWITYEISSYLNFKVYTIDNTMSGTYKIKITVTCIPNRLVYLQNVKTKLWMQGPNYQFPQVDLATPQNNLNNLWEIVWSGGDWYYLWNVGKQRMLNCESQYCSFRQWDKKIYWYYVLILNELGNNQITFFSEYQYNKAYLNVNYNYPNDYDVLYQRNQVTDYSTWNYVDKSTAVNLTDSVTFDLVMNVGCFYAVFDSTNSATKTVYNVFSQSKVVTQPFVSDNVNNVYGNGQYPSICGNSSISMTEQPNWSVITSQIMTATTSSDGEPVLKIYTTDQTQIYKHTVTIYYFLSSYTSIKTSYTMTVYICILQVTSLTADQSYTIFKTALTFYSSYFTIYPTEASSKFDITHTVTLSSGAAIPSWLTWTDTGTNLKFSVYSTTNSEKGQYSIKITGTASLDDGQTSTTSDTFTITLLDGCPYTSYESAAPTDWVSSVTYYVGQPAKTVAQPFIDDTINQNFGSSSTSSVCGTTTLYLTEVISGYNRTSVVATGSTNSFVPELKIYTTDLTQVYEHGIYVKYYLTSYTGIAKTIYWTAYVCKMYASATSAQVYTIFKTAKAFSIAYFQIRPSPAASQFVIDYTVTKSDGSAIPAWLKWTDSGTKHDFSVYSEDNSDKGTYQLKITATAKQDGVLVDTVSTTWSIQLLDGCSGTIYDAVPSSAVTSVYYYLSNTKIVNQPFISDSANNIGGTGTSPSMCGTTSVTIWEDNIYQSWTYYWVTASTSAGYPVFTIYQTSSSYVGIRTLNVKYYLTSWTGTFTTFKMTTYICQLVAPSISGKTYKVFYPDSTFTVNHFTISPSVAESKFEITYTITKSDGGTIPTWLTFIDSGSLFTFTVATSDCDFPNVGIYTIKITATAELNDGQTGTLFTTFTINLKDPCYDTDFDSTSTALKRFVYYIGYKYDLEQPWVSDSVNNQVGTSTTQSICGPTTVTAVDINCEPRYEMYDPMASGSVATYSPVLIFETFNTNWVANGHTLTVTYALSRYPSVTTSYEMSIAICILIPPTISDQYYTIFSGSKTYQIPYFTIAPSETQPEFKISYSSVTQSNDTAIWSWLSWTDSGSGLVLTVLNSLYSDAGTYIVKITSKAEKVNGDGQTGFRSTTFKLILIDPCKSKPTAIVNDGTATAQASFLLGTTISVTQPWFSDTVNNLYGTGTSVSLCFTTTATVWESGSAPAYAAISNSLITPILTFTTSTTNLVGTHSITIKYTLDRYTTLSYSLPMTVYICTLVPPNIATKYYTIFSGDYNFTVPYFTISPNSQQSLYTRSHIATQSDGTALWGWLKFTDSGSETLSFTANSTTYSDDLTAYSVIGQKYTILITSTATMSDGQTQTISTTFFIVLTDPCKNTVLIQQTIPDQWQFIGASYKTLVVKMPLITDTVNKRYGTDPLNSICFTQFIKSKEGDFQSQNFVNLTIQKTGVLYTTMYISEKDNDLFGPHVVNFTYTLDRYPHIQTTKSATITLIKVTPPAQPEDQIYYLNSDKLYFSNDMMEVEPYSSDIKFTFKVTQVGGGTVPAFLTYTEDKSVENDLDLEMETSNSNDVGKYQIQINCTATHTNNQTASEVVKFWITVYANVTDQTKQQKSPVWTSKVADPLLVTVGQPLVYNLPPVVSPVGNPFKIDVELGAADKFVTYENGTFKIGNTTNQQVGTYPVKVTITDSKGAKTVTTLNMVVRAASQAQNLTAARKWQNETIQVQKTLSKLEKIDNLNVSGWSYTDAFLKAKARGAMQLIPPKPPTVTFSNISRTGELVLAFSKDMIVPPLQKLQNVSVSNETGSKIRLLRIRRLQESAGNDSSKQCGVAHPKVVSGSENQVMKEDEMTYECAPAQPKVIPGDENQADQLGYSFRIVSQTARQLRMQLIFENPLKVSTNPDEPEYCEIHFLGNYFFFDEDGMTIPEDTVVRRRIPVLIPIEGFTYQMMSAGVYATAAVQAAMVCCFFLFLCMARPLLKLLWSMIRTWQIILMLPLFNLSMPGNAAIFFPFLWQIASFDFIPTDQFYNDVLGWNPTFSVDQNFEDNGFGSQLFLYNIGSIMLAIILYPILVALYLFLRCCCSKKHKQYWGQRTQKSLGECLFWTYPLVVLTMAFIVFVISTFINFKFVSLFLITNISYQIMWNGSAQQPISALFTLVFMIVVICMPVVLSIFMVFNWRRLRETSFEDKWFACYNSIFEPIDQTNGKWIILEPVTFLVRRLCLAAAALYTKKLAYQCIVMIAFCIWQVFFVTIVRPFKNNFYHQMEIFSECVIMMEVYCFMLFTDYVKDVNRKYEVGYIAIALVFFHFIVLVGLLIYQSVCEWRERVDEKREKQALVKILQNTLAAKLAVKLKQTQVQITPFKSSKIIEMSQAPELERLEEIQEVIESQEESCEPSRQSTVRVVADENQNFAVTLTDRSDDKVQHVLGITAFKNSVSQTVNDCDLTQKEFVLPPLPPIFTMEEQKEVSPPEEEKIKNQIETTSQMNQRLKRVLISKQLQKQIAMEVSLDSIDDAFRFKKSKK